MVVAMRNSASAALPGSPGCLPSTERYQGWGVPGVLSVPSVPAALRKASLDGSRE